MTRIEHPHAYQAHGDHMHEELLLKGCGRLTMPVCGAKGMFEIAIEGLDIPAHVVEPGEFRGGVQPGIQERGNETTSAKAVAINENHSDGKNFRGTRTGDTAKIISRGEGSEHPRPIGIAGGNDEMGAARQDSYKGGDVVKTVIEQEQVVFAEAFDELEDELMLGSARLAINEAQRGAADQVKQAAEFNGNGS